MPQHHPLTINEKAIIFDCLKIMAHDGSYSDGVITAFKIICEKYKIDVSYTEMNALWIEENQSKT